MSINLDRIATVDIDIINPVIEDMSFNKLLIVGPGPKNFDVTPTAGVLEYGSIVEMEEQGWITTGEDADPLGAAARVAFSQNPIPTKVYLAPTQPTGEAKRFAAVKAAVEEAIAETVGQATPSGCKVSYDSDKRVLTVHIAGASASGIKGTGAGLLCQKLLDGGYAIYIGSTRILSIDSVRTCTECQKVLDMSEGNPAVQFKVRVGKVIDGASTWVDFGVLARYPDNSNQEGPYEEYKGTLPSPVEKYEPAVDAVARALDNEDWYAVCPAGVPDDEYEAIAELIETQEKIFVYTELKYFQNGEVPTVSPTYMRTAGVVALEYADQDPAQVPAVNQYANVGFTAAWFNFQPGSETAAFKQPRGGLVSGKFSKDQMDHMERDNLNYLLSIRNRVVSMNGKMIGDEWCDMIRFRDYLKSYMQNEIVKVFLANPKIPYTDAGITLIHNAMEASLKHGQAVGGICYDEYDMDGNTIPGYVTKVPTAASISAVQRRSRKLTGCTFSARPTGAIHFAEITGSITYEISYSEGV